MRLGGTTNVRLGLAGADASTEAAADAETAAEAEAEACLASAAVLLFTAIRLSRSRVFFSSSLMRAAASSSSFCLAILSSTARPVLPCTGALAVVFDSVSLSLAALTAFGFSSTLAVILPDTFCVASGSLAGVLLATCPASLAR